MKQLSLVFALVMMLGTLAFGQRTITGSVTDANGPLPYANVIVKGTTVGVTTNLDGQYELKVPEGATTIVFSYTGYTSQETRLGDSNVMNIVLSEGVILEEAVVTALGIEREKKTLGYAAQEVGGEELTKVKDANFINSLSGKVAGVKITRSTTMGGSTDVIIRGHTSLTADNQALFVVDGVPISNGNTNTAAMQRGGGGYDYGNAASDINPEDVESVTVLRGAAATALYGSRAGNGVVLITTKKGKKGQNGIGVSLSSGVTAGKIDKSTFVKYQKEYGAGYGPFQSEGYFDLYDIEGNGTEVLSAPVYDDASYGAPFDPSVSVADWRSYHPELSTYGQTFPWKAGDNDAATFYETSLTFNNNVAISGGNDKSAFRVSYTNFDQSGIVPGSKIQKNIISFNGSHDINDKWSTGVSGSYYNVKGKGRYGTGYDPRNVNQSFRQWYQTNVDIQDQKDAYEQTGLNLTWNPKGLSSPGDPSAVNYFDNYYFTVHENYSNDQRNRIQGSAFLNYEVTDWLEFTGRVSLDRYNEVQEERTAIGSEAVASYGLYRGEFTETNYDLLMKVNKYFGADDIFSFNGLLGTNFRRSIAQNVRATTNGGLFIPKLYALSNSKNLLIAPTETYRTVGVNGYFASASFGYNNMLYVDVTGRMDVSSTLTEANNTYFYPSATLSFVFSELLPSNNIISFGKVRLNYAGVGKDAALANQGTVDNFVLNAPLNGNALASASTTKKNQDLRAERTNGWEAGIEVNFLKNRIGLDLSVYQQNSKDQIASIATSGAYGFTQRVSNVGTIQNKGVEISLNLTPVKTKNFTWDMGINWARNVNEVTQLNEGLTNIQLNNYQGGVSINATLGESYGSIWGSNYVMHDGQPIVAPYGGGARYRQTVAPEVIGNINPDWIGGVSNTFSYQGVSLGFLIDVQKGGDFFSLDTWYGYATGLYEFTAGTNDKGNPVRDLPADGGGIRVDGVLHAQDDLGNYLYDTDGNAISTGEVNTELYGYAADYRSAFGYFNAPNAFHINDASYVKLREMSLTYSLPAKMFENNLLGGIDISLVGRNLWIIHKNTLYSDPEAGLSAGNSRGNQSGAYPSVKEFGFNLNVKF